LPQRHFDQRAFAGSVGAGDAKPLAAEYVKGKIFKQHQRIKLLAEIFRPNDQVALFCRLGKTEFDGLQMLGLMRKSGLSCKRLFKPCFSSAGDLARPFPIFVASDEVAGALDEFHLAFVFPLLLEFELFPLDDISAVIAAPYPRAFIIHRDNFGYDIIEQKRS